MTITLQAVNELIASLDSAGELSIRETKVMALAKAFKQLAAENVALKESRNNLAEFIHEELDADYPLNMNLETHATDRIVAGIKADGVALVKSAFEEHIQSSSCYQDEVIGMESALSIASQVESQLREGADKC
ncbi:hypothetical protein ACPQUH_01925 [Klebsiella pneumoniae]|uniref:hypothetical protein n=1 Tax=Klebsiella pneumoniae TaxID=573 RepID=UPI003B5B95C4